MGHSTGPTTRRNWEEAHTLINPQITSDGNHKWPFDLEFPIDVRFFRFRGSDRIHRNRHDYLGLLFLFSGELTWQIQDRKIVQRQGELFVIGSSLYHRLWSQRDIFSDAMVLYFLPELIQHGDIVGGAQEYLMPFRIQDASFPHVVPARTGLPMRALDLMKRIHNELPAFADRSRLAVKTYLKMILISLVNYYSDYQATREVIAHREASIHRLHPLFDLLESRYKEVIAIQEAVDAVGMSKSHFRRFFKQLTGQSFITYVNRFRIAKAQELLASTNESIVEISQEVGFCDQSYFGLVFRQLIHITPLQYRKTVHGSSGPQGSEEGSPFGSLSRRSSGPSDQGEIIEKKLSSSMSLA